MSLFSILNFAHKSIGDDYMITKALRLHGKNDIRLSEIVLPEITEDEVLIRVISDSVCASTYKAIKQGSSHKRVPENIADNPVIIGHELCGEIVEVGASLTAAWKVGQKIVLQPALKLSSGHDPGYSYPYIGGNTQYAVVPKLVLERGCLLPYEGEGFFKGSLVEALACIIRGYKGFYHTDYTNYVRTDGAKKGGKLAILGGAGPMGIGAVELGVGYAGVSQIVVTDLDQNRLDFAARMSSPKYALEKGVDLQYINTKDLQDPVKLLIELSDGGFDDVFVMVPVPALFTMAEKICRDDGCINFFAGPAVHDLPGSLNLYRVHYDGIHVVGTAGSIPQDMIDVIELIEKDAIHPGALVSHILGLNSAEEALFAMENPSGAKKVCYNELDLPVIAIEDLDELGKTDPMFQMLAAIVNKNGGMWCAEAERYLLANAPRL